MNKRFIICAAILLVLITLGILAYTSLEIYPRKVPVFPSRDTIANDYFALERWLAETGHPVRAAKGGDLSRLVSGAEKTAFVEASACDWENSGAILMPWIEGGGFLLINLDYSFYDEDLAGFLADLGIGQDEYPSENSADEDDGEAAESLADMDEPPDARSVPDFDRRVQFFIDKAKTARTGAKVFTIKDSTGAIRLAELSLGKGALALIGRPRFMFNHYLDREINARMAWNLTGARTSAENPGLLFIREKRVTKGFLGKIADRGNFFPLVISALILIVLGFWMVIPMAGLVFSEKQSRARPIRERFLAEIRFLKKYGALQSYLEIYLRELKLRGREGVSAEIEQETRSTRRMKYRDIIKALRKLESLTEQT